MFFGNSFEMTLFAHGYIFCRQRLHPLSGVLSSLPVLTNAQMFPTSCTWDPFLGVTMLCADASLLVFSKGHKGKSRKNNNAMAFE